jgi:hypothetical protein
MMKESKHTGSGGVNMNKHNDGLSDFHDEYLPLAQWLQQVLAITPQPKAELASITDNGGQFGDGYHIEFYQQLPDFAMALLNNDTQATLRFAPLLFHLIGCPACHAAYTEIYDAMRATVPTVETSSPIGQWSQSMANTSTRMLVYVCRLLINQAETILRQARHDHVDHDAWARSLLQQAIHISSHLMQSTLRQRALRDLVEVATLFDVTTTTATHTYTPVLTTGGGSRHGSKTRRRAETLGRRVDQHAIYLQSGLTEKEGVITQNEDTLELHLENLGQELHSQFLIISVPLGSLLEPVRWIGGNPLAIRSQVPVNEDGTLTTPLGFTDLRISDPEDHNLLEAMFRKLDVRPAA